jgi:DNA-binding beta-propeller fold protein YncE
MGIFFGGWGTLGRPPGKFDFPAGVACSPDTGYVFVADAKNDYVQSFAKNGSFLESWGGTGSSVGSFNYPLGIAVSWTGARVFVADTHNNRIQWFNRDEVAVIPASLGRVKALFR